MERENKSPFLVVVFFIGRRTYYCWEAVGRWEQQPFFVQFNSPWWRRIFDFDLGLSVESAN